MVGENNFWNATNSWDTQAYVEVCWGLPQKIEEWKAEALIILKLYLFIYLMLKKVGYFFAGVGLVNAVAYRPMQTYL